MTKPEIQKKVIFLFPLFFKKYISYFFRFGFWFRGSVCCCDDSRPLFGDVPCIFADETGSKNTVQLTNGKTDTANPLKFKKIPLGVNLETYL